MANYVINIVYDDKTFTEVNGILLVDEDYWESDRGFTIALKPRKPHPFPQTTITYKCHYPSDDAHPHMHMANKWLAYIPMDSRFTMRLETSKYNRQFLTLMCGADVRIIEIVVM